MALSSSGRGWSGWSLTRRLRVAVVVLSAVLLIAGLAVVTVLRQADQTIAYQTDRTVPARRAAIELLTSLLDQETGLRGFALTGDPQFLEPYRQGLIDEQAARSQLDQYVKPGDPAHLPLLSVDAAITAWRDQYASLHTAGGGRLTGSEQTLRFGKELFERVRTASNTLDAELSREVASARADADRDRRTVLFVLAAMAVVVAAALFGLQRALQSSVIAPMRQLREQVAAVSHGDRAASIAPTGPSDIVEMGLGVESMRVALVGALAEIEAQQRGLERRAAELARSNADLEQFAYVASHDLQEPLRKVASFCQLLEQRYGDQLDDRAHQYIEFAVDGARRMQLLITDLLTFSRVGRTNEAFVDVDITTTIERAWHSLEAKVTVAQGELRLQLAPDARCVVGAPSLLEMLLSNLFGNALKYRRPDASPVIEVTGKAEGSWGHFLVADNGIGIPPEYAEKVFVIFQRLHGRDEYEGTGIGLALAKKVVEYHGGTIALVKSPLGGACVSFTLPLAESSQNA